MAKEPKISSAATGASTAEEPQKDAATAPVIAETASAPSGESAPGGTNPPQSEGSDAAGTASASEPDPVKLPQEVQSTEAMVAEAAQAPSILTEPEASGTVGAVEGNGPKVVSEVRYGGKTYRPGDYLPGGVNPDLLKTYRDFDAI